MKVRADEVERAAVQRDAGGLLQGPAHARRREAEGGRGGHDPHLGARDAARERDADAVEEGIARGEHDDGPAARRQHCRDGPLEGAEPGAGLAADRRAGKLQVPCAAEDDLGHADGGLGLIAETG